MNALQRALDAHRLLPVLAVSGPDEASGLGQALASAGLPLAEVTLRLDGALDALRCLAGQDLFVGAGTVVTADQVDLAVDAGARFVVCPGLRPAVVRRCRDRAVPVVPGVATASDLMHAVELGLDTVKLFPAELIGGPAAVAAFAAPFPGMRFVPTGGVRPQNLGSYLSLGAVAAVGGSWLAPREVVVAADWGEVSRRTRAAVEQIREVA